MVCLASFMLQTLVADLCLLPNYSFPAGIPQVGSEEMGNKNAGNEKACVGQLCHIQEQLQLYVEESIPRVSRKCRSCTASQQHMIDICILCNELKQYKRGLLHGDRVGTHLLIILVHWPWTWTWTHRRLDSKALCSPSSDVPFTKPSVALLNTPVLILLRILVKVKVLHL